GGKFPFVCEASSVPTFAGPDLGKFTNRRTQFGNGRSAGKESLATSAWATDSSTRANRGVRVRHSAHFASTSDRDSRAGRDEADGAQRVPELPAGTGPSSVISASYFDDVGVRKTRYSCCVRRRGPVHRFIALNPATVVMISRTCRSVKCFFAPSMSVSVIV